jgi:hypothetical protein
LPDLTADPIIIYPEISMDTIGISGYA